MLILLNNWDQQNFSNITHFRIAVIDVEFKSDLSLGGNMLNPSSVSPPPEGGQPLTNDVMVVSAMT